MDYRYPTFGAADERGGYSRSPLPTGTGNLSFAERAAQLYSSSQAPPPPPSLSAATAVEAPKPPPRTPTPVARGGGRDIMRDIDRAPPGDPGLRPRKSQAGGLGLQLAQQRSQYFEDVFSVRNAGDPARERARGEAMIMAEVKTNLILNDELAMIADLSSCLSARYRRPASSIIVTLQHSTCMSFGGTFEPAYILSVFALPSELQPATNRRNAALIQQHMDESIGVVPARGYIRFVPVAEENVAHNGKTMAAEMDELAKGVGGGGGTAPTGVGVAGGGVLNSPAESLGLAARRLNKVGKKLSVKSFGSFRAHAAQTRHAELLTPPASAGDEARPLTTTLPSIPQEGPAAEREENTASSRRREEKKPRRAKSFVATIFGRSSTPKREAISPLLE